MRNDLKWRPPPLLVVLDLAGAGMLALGLIEWVAPGTAPLLFPLPHHGVALMIVGVLLMLPLIFHIVARARRVRDGQGRSSTVTRSRR